MDCLFLGRHFSCIYSWYFSGVFVVYLLTGVSVFCGVFALRKK